MSWYGRTTCGCIVVRHDFRGGLSTRFLARFLHQNERTVKNYEREVNACERFLKRLVSDIPLHRIQKATDASKTISDMCNIYNMYSNAQRITSTSLQMHIL